VTLLLRCIVSRRTNQCHVPHVFALGKALFAEASKRGMEGIVAGQPLQVRSLRSPWMKIENANYTQKRGQGGMFNGRRNHRGVGTGAIKAL
jgi:hypothetical protein